MIPGYRCRKFIYSISILAVAMVLINGCDNALFDTAKELQAQTVTPVISVSLGADYTSSLLAGNLVDPGTTLNMGNVTLGSSFTLKLSIANKGKTPLAIADDAFTLSGVDADKFSVTQKPAAGIAPSSSGELWISIDTSVETTGMAANLTIATNDINTPVFALELASAVVNTPTPIAPVNLMVDHYGSDPGNFTKLKLAWDEVGLNTTGYSIMRSTVSSSGPFTEIATVTPNTACAYEDTTCSPGTMYYYRVYSVNSSQYSMTAAKESASTTGTPVTGISVNPYSTALNYPGRNSTLNLSPVFSGSAPSIQALAWASSNTGVATVVDGLVTAVGLGSATITLTSTDNTNISATCPITVSTPRQVLYLANFGGYLDYDFIDTQTWSKSQSGYGAVGDGPSCTVVDASGKFLYESNTGTNPLVLGVSGNLINQANGALGLINRVYPGTVTEGLMVASPNGPTGQQFVYCTFPGVGQVGAFAINNATGWLSPIGGFPPPLTLVYWSDGSGSGGNPRWLAVNPSGKNLYVSNSNIDKISMFSIDAATGILTYGSSYPTGDLPYKSAVSPDGKYLYVVNVNGASVSAFSIDSANGALVLVGTYATGTTPTCVAIDPLQRYAYVTNGGSNTITAYTIDAGTGALAPVNGTVAGSSYATWVYPNSVAVDMTGTHLVVASSISNKATVYAITAGTGALTLKISFDTGLYPTHVAFQRLP